MSREVHVRFCGGLEVRFLRSTQFVTFISTELSLFIVVNHIQIENMDIIPVTS